METMLLLGKRGERCVQRQQEKRKSRNAEHWHYDLRKRKRAGRCERRRVDKRAGGRRVSLGASEVDSNCSSMVWMERSNPEGRVCKECGESV